MPEQDDPHTEPDPAPPGKTATGAARGYGVDLEDPAARSPRVQLAAAVVAMLLVVGVAMHLVFVTLHVAPENQLSRKYKSSTDTWIYPLFEQNWRLFAPNPLSVNTMLDARARVRAADGTVTEGPWTGLTADDIAHIRGNPFPSKADQNLLRRAWEFYNGSHNADGTAANGNAAMSEQYLRRIAVQRIGGGQGPGTVVAVQLRAVSTAIPAPGSAATEPTVRDLGWWETKPDDFR